MDQDKKRHIALHAPNIVSVCVDGYENGEPSGRIYHCYDTDPWMFTDVVTLIERTDALFDSISFPQASTRIRELVKTERIKKETPEKVTTAQSVAEHRGGRGTFLMQVQYRQNSSWQGEVEWLEGAEIQRFKSELELLKILSNSLNRSCMTIE